MEAKQQKHGNYAVPSSLRAERLPCVLPLGADRNKSPAVSCGEGYAAFSACAPLVHFARTPSQETFTHALNAHRPRVLVHPRRQCAKEGKAIEKKRLNLAQARCSFLQKARVSSDR